MKASLFVCLLIAFFQVDASLWSITLNDQEKLCVKELNLKENKIINLYFRHITAENITQLNDFVHCVWRLVEFQNEDGEVNYENLKKSYDLGRRIGEDDPALLNRMDELVCDAVNACEKNPPARGDTHGQTAVKVQNCIAENYIKATRE